LDEHGKSDAYFQEIHGVSDPLEETRHKPDRLRRVVLRLSLILACAQVMCEREDQPLGTQRLVRLHNSKALDRSTRASGSRVAGKPETVPTLESYGSALLRQAQKTDRARGARKTGATQRTREPFDRRTPPSGAPRFARAAFPRCRQDPLLLRLGHPEVAASRA